jgi:hypothetical protein
LFFPIVGAKGNDEKQQRLCDQSTDYSQPKPLQEYTYVKIDGDQNDHPNITIAIY